MNLDQFLEENPNWPLESKSFLPQTILNRINSDNWIHAHRIDDDRILVLRFDKSRSLPWIIHYYYVEQDCYEHGVYIGNETRALRHFQYTLEGYQADLLASFAFLGIKERQQAARELEDLLNDFVEEARQTL